MSKSIDQILATHDERLVRPKPQELFNLGYANVHLAADKISAMSDKNVGNMTRAEILEVLKLCRDATANLQGLEQWRNKNPHPDEQWT